MSSHCLICFGDLESRDISFEPIYNFPGSLNSTVLNQQLWSSFILTRIIDLPKWKFEHLLKSTSPGIHPGDWFNLCEICEINVVNIVEIQNQINSLQFKFNKLVNQVKAKFKSSLLEEEELTQENNGQGHSHGQINDVSEEIRQFFKIIREQHQTKVEVNIDTEITQETEDDWNWEPSINLDEDHIDDRDNPSSGSEEWKIPVTKKRPIIKRKGNRKRRKGLEASEKGQCRIYYTPGAYHCTICTRKLKTQHLLDKHYKLHDKTKRKFDGRFDCTICKAPFARLFHLKNHYQNVHKLEVPNQEDNHLSLKMEVDDEDGKTPNTFNGDQVELDNDKLHGRSRALDLLSNVSYTFHQCSICPRKLSSQELMDKHYKYHEYTKRKFNCRFDCTICKAPCARLFHLRNHYQNVHKLELPKNWDVNEQDDKVNQPKMEVDPVTQTGDDDDEETQKDLEDNQIKKPNRKRRVIKKPINHVDSEDSTFQCSLCTHKYRSQASLNKHLDYHQMTKTKYNGKFDCDKCGTPFARVLHLTNHYRNVHQCTLDLDKLKDQQDHDQSDISAEQNNFKCPEPECKFFSKKLDRLNYHLKVKHGEKRRVNDLPVVCELCGFKAKEGDYRKQQMQRHMLNHKIFDASVNPSISTTDLICTLCNQLFKSRTDLRSHKVTIHASELGLTSHQCSYCPRLFPNKKNLFDHEQRIHKKKGRFPCPHCDHEAMNPYRLGQHMAKHTKDRDICQYCSATYTKTGGRLREHIKRHHPDKYAPSTSRLKYTGVPMENNDIIDKKPKLRRFKCKYCCSSNGGGCHNNDGIVYESQLAYTMHLEESHKDLYKYKCELCGNDGDDDKKVYMSLTSLNYHKKIHHEEKGKGAKCGWCGVKVAHKFYLYGHRKNCRNRPEGAKGILAMEDKDNN